MSFSELKRETGIESSGHLQFHLGKLSSLIKTDTVGNYALTDEGRGALHIAQTVVPSETMLRKCWTKIDTAIIAVSIVWALTMVATSMELSGTGFDSVVMILGGGFVACLLILTRLARSPIRFGE